MLLAARTGRWGRDGVGRVHSVITVPPIFWDGLPPNDLLRDFLTSRVTSVSQGQEERLWAKGLRAATAIDAPTYFASKENVGVCRLSSLCPWRALRQRVPTANRRAKDGVQRKSTVCG